MNYVLKDISHPEFFEKLNHTSIAVTQLRDQENLDTEEYRTRADQLITATKAHILRHIIPDTTDIISMLNTSYSRHEDLLFDFYDFEKEPDIRKETQRLDRFEQSLNQLIAYLKIVDSLIDKDQAPKIETVSEKNDFVLKKLHTLFSGGSYSIQRIMELNGIEFRSGEPREIAEDLHRRGYVSMDDRWGEKSLAKISIKGANYVERKARQKKSKNVDTDLSKKLDSVLEHLSKLGAGQEIIFDEIGELKELQLSLSKKTWSQLLKGKLLDLAIDKIISTETATFVYEYLTNGDLKLLKFP